MQALRNALYHKTAELQKAQEDCFTEREAKEAAAVQVVQLEATRQRLADMRVHMDAILKDPHSDPNLHHFEP